MSGDDSPVPQASSESLLNPGAMPFTPVQRQRPLEPNFPQHFAPNYIRPQIYRAPMYAHPFYTAAYPSFQPGFYRPYRPTQVVVNNPTSEPGITTVMPIKPNSPAPAEHVFTHASSEHLEQSSDSSHQFPIDDALASLELSLKQILTNQHDILKLTSSAIVEQGSQLEATLKDVVMVNVSGLVYDAILDRMVSDGKKEMSEREESMKEELITIITSAFTEIVTGVQQMVPQFCFERFQSKLWNNIISKLTTNKIGSLDSRFQAAHIHIKGCHFKFKSIVDTLCSEMSKRLEETIKKGFCSKQHDFQQLEELHRKLAFKLQAELNSLSIELQEGYNNVLSRAASFLHEVDVRNDIRKPLHRLITETKYEDAFTIALRMKDVNVLSWLCSEANLSETLLVNPLPLSQGVLLSLIYILSHDMNTERLKKLVWVKDSLSAVKPMDPVIAVHVRPILEEVFGMLSYYRTIPTTSSAEHSKIRFIMHVINSMLL